MRVIQDGLDDVRWAANLGTNYILCRDEQHRRGQRGRGSVAQRRRCTGTTSERALCLFRRGWDIECALSQLHLISVHKTKFYFKDIEQNQTIHCSTPAYST